MAVIQLLGKQHKRDGFDCDKAKAFYSKLGFISCMDSPLSLHLPVATLEQSLAA